MVAEAIETEKNLTVFISYSWDSAVHKEWVLNLANKLTADGGINVIIDRYDLKVGKPATHFMEKAVDRVDKVLMIMTPNYKEKAENRKGGVGYEYSMVTQELYEKQDSEKFIPIRRKATNDECAPKFLKSYISHDMTNDATFDKDFKDLLRIIYNEPEIKRPPLGKKPSFITKNIATSLIDDKANFDTDARINGYAKWSIDIRLTSLSDQNESELFKLLTSNILTDKETQFSLPYILFNTYKTSHHPEIIYDSELHSNNLSGNKEQEKLKIETGLIHYEYSEYSSLNSVLLNLSQPFLTLFYLLVIINTIHEQLKKAVEISIDIKFSSDKKALLSSQLSPFKYPKIYSWQTMEIPDGKAQLSVNLSSITKNNVFKLFDRIYGLFVAENPKSSHPFVALDRESFDLFTNEYIETKSSTISFGRNVSKNSYD